MPSALGWRDLDASWGDVVSALRVISKNVLALEIEKKLLDPFPNHREELLKSLSLQYQPRMTFLYRPANLKMYLLR